MPSIVASGGSVRGLLIGGRVSICDSTGGAPSCCGGCPYYYMARLCNLECGTSDDHIYVCATAMCPNTGGYQGQVLGGTVVRVGSRCYLVDASRRYCRPGTVPGPNDPAEGCEPMPTRKPVFDVPPRCEWTCGQGCPPLTGWYPAIRCSNGQPASGPVFVPCACYEQARLTYTCPVWRELGPGLGTCRCYYVPNGTQPVNELPPNAVIVGEPTLQHCGALPNCCTCCPPDPPECCRCTQGSTLQRWFGCEYIQNTFPPLDGACESWAAESASVNGCGAVVVQQLNFGNLCPVTMVCYQMVGSNRVRETVHQFPGDCSGGGTTRCVGCGDIVVGQPIPGGTTITEYDVLPCSTGQQTFGVPFFLGVGQSASPPCCPTGQRLFTCRSFESTMQHDATPCGGQKVTESYFFSLTPTPGLCGAEDCGPGLVYRDGSPIDSSPSLIRAGSSPPGGCAGCGSKDADTTF